MSNPKKKVEESTKTEVETYQFEPIKGYPMLNWYGKRPFTSTQYFPAQIKEVHGDKIEDWRNKIYWGDNLQVMSHLLKEFRSQVKLAYIDPPFDSKANYKLPVKIRRTSTSNDHSVFEEKQYTDIWINDEYLQFMYERLILIRELLSDDGSLYLHCDWHRSHYLRCIADEIFGSENFINEIVWKRASTVKGNVGQGSKFLGANTDTIFLYKKGGDYTFNFIFTDYSDEYIEQFYKHIDEQTGKRYQLISMTAPGGADKGNPLYEVMGVVRYWRYSEEKMKELIEQGLVVQTKPGNVPRRKLYLDDGQGVPIQSLWDDIPGLSSQSSERVGYPTQKPESLIRRILEISSDPGDLVFDCFMGSGTTQAVAMKLGRRFLGVDINLGSIQITTKRLLKVSSDLTDSEIPQPSLISEESSCHIPVFSSFEIYNVNNYDIFRNPLEAKDLLLEVLEVNRLEQGHLFDGEKDGRLVKIMPINRIAARADLNELIAGMDYKAFERRQAENPKHPVEKIILVCMGHEPDLAAVLIQEVQPFNIDVEVVDILRDKKDLQFKRDSEAQIIDKNGNLIIQSFYPMNLLRKMSLQKESVDEWRELVESIMIDWNYDGAIMEPSIVDIPDKDEFVKGKYKIPEDAGTIRVKITDILSESLEQDLQYG